MASDLQRYTAVDIGGLVNCVVDATRQFDHRTLWWRGQASVEWKLHPSLYHKALAANETNMVVRFMNYARVRHRDVPSVEDGPSWLFLMQHYGLPTRLLDWSQSPLTALHFAVGEEEFHERDGMVWGLQPTQLNKEQVGSEAILGTGNQFVRPVFNEAWKSRSGKRGEEKVLAITAQHVDVRQMVQSSEFTLHGTSQPIDELPNADKFLVGISIPSAVKGGMAQALKLLHITDSYLFPDLEHLAKDLQKQQYHLR